MKGSSPTLPMGALPTGGKLADQGASEAKYDSYGNLVSLPPSDAKPDMMRLAYKTGQVLADYVSDDGEMYEDLADCADGRDVLSILKLNLPALVHQIEEGIRDKIKERIRIEAEEDEQERQRETALIAAEEVDEYAKTQIKFTGHETTIKNERIVSGSKAMTVKSGWNRADIPDGCVINGVAGPAGWLRHGLDYWLNEEDDKALAVGVHLHGKEVMVFYKRKDSMVNARLTLKISPTVPAPSRITREPITGKMLMVPADSATPTITVGDCLGGTTLKPVSVGSITDSIAAFGAQKLLGRSMMNVEDPDGPERPLFVTQSDGISGFEYDLGHAGEVKTVSLRTGPARTIKDGLDIS